MTKKEIAAFNRLHDEALGKYMEYVMKGNAFNAPSDVLERACVFSELKKMFFPDDIVETGA